MSEGDALHSRHPPAVTYSQTKTRNFLSLLSKRRPMRPFIIIPVLDLKQGLVVHARAGDRAQYRPIQSCLSPSAEAGAVLDGLLALAPFPVVYIADLDRITGAGISGGAGHAALIRELASRHKAVEFWVDGGFRTLEDAGGSGGIPVLGSESWTDSDGLGRAVAGVGAENCVLSLDYRGDRFVGPEDLPQRPEIWPERVIAMTLSRVGSGAGPDLARLRALRQFAGAARFFAAGGVRGRGDLEALRAMGIAGALVASALHDGSLTKKEIAEFAEP